MKRITLPKILDSLRQHEGGGRDRSRDRREGAPRGRAHDLSEELNHAEPGRTDSIVQSLLYPGGFLSPLEIDDAVTRALAEDLGRAGDVTSIATIPDGTPARAVVVARKAGTIAGLPLVAAVLPQARAGHRDHGRWRATATRVAAKTALMTIDGDARAVLSAERAALNFLGHLSGIATATAAFVRKVGRQDPHLLHAQDHAGAARAGEIRGALRRRLQSPLRPRRRDPDQGQPHRGRGRRPRRCWSARAPRPAIWSRSRSRSTRSTSCSEVLDCRPRRRGAARQFRCRRR